MFAYPYLSLRRRSLIRNLLFHLQVQRDRLVGFLSTSPTIFGLCSSGHGRNRNFSPGGYVVRGNRRRRMICFLAMSADIRSLTGTLMIRLGVAR
jgi:hypothetical protein